jgi:hypothetical protein
MRKHTSKIIVAAEPDGHVDFVARLAEQAVDSNADVVVLLGSLASKPQQPKTHLALLKALAESRLPAFYIPGPNDAPLREFLQEAASSEMAFPYVHGVHDTFALAPGHVLFVGMGGAILDQGEAMPDETESLAYPGWEVEYRLKFLQEIKDYEKVFLFTTFPEHKGSNLPGSSALAEVIKTYKPRLVLIGGTQRRTATLGTSLVIAPGSLVHGNFSVVDLKTGEAKPGLLRGFAHAA